MSNAAAAVRPVIGRPDVDSVLVEVLRTDVQERQEAVVAAIAATVQTHEWPVGLLSLNCYSSSDGASVMTYTQWSSEEAMRQALAGATGVTRGASDWGVPGIEPGNPVPFRLYRVVRGSAVDETAAVPQCFPVAFFAMPDAATARRWIDDMLASEESTEGSERAYPGALAANFHISLDGRQVLVLSEWLSEAEAVAHIEAVWEPLLAQVGEGNTGARFRHHLTLTDPDHPVTN